MTPERIARMIAKKGQPATWRVLRTDYAEKPWKPVQQTESDVDCLAVVLPTGLAGQETYHAGQGGQPASLSMAFVSAPVGVSPKRKDLLIVGADRYRVESLELTQLQGTLLLIEARVMKQ